jgi:hypothetical protein
LSTAGRGEACTHFGSTCIPVVFIIVSENYSIVETISPSTLKQLILYQPSQKYCDQKERVLSPPPRGNHRVVDGLCRRRGIHCLASSRGRIYMCVRRWVGATLHEESEPHQGVVVIVVTHRSCSCCVRRQCQFSWTTTLRFVGPPTGSRFERAVGPILPPAAVAVADAVRPIGRTGVADGPRGLSGHLQWPSANICARQQ